MDGPNIIQNVHQRIQQQKSQPTLCIEATLVPCTCCLTATVADDGPDEAPSSTRCAAACSWRFPRSGSALLCGRDGSHAKLHTSREGSQMQERRSKKERWKEIQRFFPNRSPSGLEGGGGGVCQSHEDECLRRGTRLLFAAER